MTNHQFYMLMFAIIFSGAVVANSTIGMVLSGIYVVLAVVSLWDKP